MPWNAASPTMGGVDEGPVVRYGEHSAARRRGRDRVMAVRGPTLGVMVILLVHGSRSGWAERVATQAADVLRADGHDVTLAAAATDPSPAVRVELAGGYDPATVSLPERLLMKAMKTAPGDHVDDAAVAAFARSLLD